MLYRHERDLDNVAKAVAMNKRQSNTKTTKLNTVKKNKYIDPTFKSVMVNKVYLYSRILGREAKTLVYFSLNLIGHDQ